jgi:ribonuclease HI
LSLSSAFDLPTLVFGCTQPATPSHPPPLPPSPLPPPPSPHPSPPPLPTHTDVLDIIRRYDQLRTVIHTDGSAVGGVKRGGSSAVVTSGDPGNPTFLNVRHQYGPEHTTSLEVEMWGLWLALDCLDDETAAAGVLICSDSQWALNALKESGHSAHSILSPLWDRLRGLGGRICFQWVPAHCGLLGNERADKAALLMACKGEDIL